jgi:peptidoglycan/xylan/chitin deacetylase (PgdA/CDA1 family)
MGFRLDRTVSLGVARIMSSRQHPVSPGRLPILMYHGINDHLHGRHPYFEINTSLKAFRGQLEALSASGYRTINLAPASSISRSGGTDRAVVLTFDDGLADFYDNALPMLLEFGFTATLYVITGFTKNQRLIKDDKTFLSWQDIRELSRYGIQVGSHTRNHHKLHEMSRSQAFEEVRSSKETLEDKLGVSVKTFAYPYAFAEHDKAYAAFIRDSLQRCGYDTAVSTIIGTAGMQSDPYRLRRLPVNTFDDDALFDAKLAGGYEWLHGLQYAKKLFTRRPAR